MGRYGRDPDDVRLDIAYWKSDLADHQSLIDYLRGQHESRWSR